MKWIACLTLLAGCAVGEAPEKDEEPEVPQAAAELPPTLGDQPADMQPPPTPPPEQPPPMQPPPEQPPPEQPPPEQPPGNELPPPADPAPPEQDPPQNPPPQNDPPPADPPPNNPPPQAAGNDCGVGLPAEMARRISGLRGAPINCDQTPMRAAQAHADDMCARDYFAVSAPDGTEPDDRMRQAGAGDIGALGITLGGGTDDIDSILAQWTGNGDIAAMLRDNRFNWLGVGYAGCGGSHFWAVYLVEN